MNSAYYNHVTSGIDRIEHPDYYEEDWGGPAYKCIQCGSEYADKDMFKAGFRECPDCGGQMEQIS